MSSLILTVASGPIISAEIGGAVWSEFLPDGLAPATAGINGTIKQMAAKSPNPQLLTPTPSPPTEFRASFGTVTANFQDYDPPVKDFCPAAKNSPHAAEQKLAHPPSFFLRISLTILGFALPLIAFIT